MSIFGSILEKLGMRRHRPEPDIRPLPGRAPAGATVGAKVGTPTPGSTSGANTAPTAATSAAAPAPMSEVDVEAKLEAMAQANPQKLNWRTSIVDLMKLLGMESSLAERKELATELGCPPEKMADSAQMNIWLHKAVLRKLAENGGKVPASLLD
jgi:hypothetical protein